MTLRRSPARAHSRSRPGSCWSAGRSTPTADTGCRWRRAIVGARDAARQHRLERRVDLERPGGRRWSSPSSTSSRSRPACGLELEHCSSYRTRRPARRSRPAARPGPPARAPRRLVSEWKTLTVVHLPLLRPAQYCRTSRALHGTRCPRARALCLSRTRLAPARLVGRRKRLRERRAREAGSAASREPEPRPVQRRVGGAEAAEGDDARPLVRGEPLGDGAPRRPRTPPTWGSR